MYGFYNPYQIPQQQSFTPQSFNQGSTTAGDDRIWVQGEAGAKGYMIVPGATVALWDSERQRIYIKSVSANGIPSMQAFDYSPVIHEEIRTAPSVDKSFEERLSKLETIVNKIKEERRNESDANDQSAMRLDIG